MYRRPTFRHDTGSFGRPRRSSTINSAYSSHGQDVDPFYGDIESIPQKSNETEQDQTQNQAQKKTLIILASWQSKMDKLTPKQQELFLQNSQLEGFQTFASKLQHIIQKRVDNSKLFEFTRKIKPFYDLVNLVTPVVSAASQSCPVPPSAILGGITCILSLGARLDDYQARIIETLASMAGELSILDKYHTENLFANDPDIQASHIDIVTDVLDFCTTAAKIFFDDDGKERKGLSLLLKAQLKNFDATFRDIKAEFQRHVIELEKLITLANSRRLRLIQRGIAAVDASNQIERRQMVAEVKSIDNRRALDRAFNHFPQIQVDDGANENDIKSYISEKVDEVNLDPSPEEYQGFAEIKDLMLSKAGGTFLWVRIKVKDFKDIGSVEDIKEALQDPVEGLDEIYGQAIRRILARQKYSRDRALRALLWVANAHRSPSKLELLEALAIKPGRTGLSATQRLPRDFPLSTECFDLIVEVDGYYQLIHASLKDFLLSQDPSLSDYGKDQLNAHDILAEICLTYLTFDVFRSVSKPDVNDLEKLLTQYPFLDYAALYWGKHFALTKGSRTKSLDKLLAILLRTETLVALCIDIIELDELTRGRLSMSRIDPILVNSEIVPLEMAISQESYSALDALIKAGLDLETETAGVTPLFWAASKGFLKAVELLITAGADVEHTGPDGWTALHHTAAYGNPYVISELLKGGAKIMSSIPDHGANALHLAADRGNLEAVEQLLDYSENLEFVDALDSYGHTPLMKALQCNDTELALLLLQHGARHDLDEWAQVVPKRFFSELCKQYSETCCVANSSSRTIIATLTSVCEVEMQKDAEEAHNYPETTMDVPPMPAAISDGEDP
ncbi:hypothetical protein TrVFT333_003978 [Trichoderma virens FT-333]|nr:hypothetical protein TrVFT333_003978 [Trichoderma virens FT-333]